MARHPSGAKSRSRFHHGGERIAEVLWEEDGTPSWGWRLRRGKRHGPSVEWWPNGRVAFVEPFVDGLVHGVARHFDDQGKLLLRTRYVKGTGVDLWCDLSNRSLAEETRLRGGTLHGVRRWWNGDGRTVWLEEPYRDGKLHGIVREWHGKLRRRFFVDGEQVDKRTYLRDASLPPYRADDDRPERPLPAEIVGQPIHVEMWKRRKRPSIDWRRAFAGVRDLDGAVARLRTLLVRVGYAEVAPLVTVELVRRRRLDWRKGSHFFACHTLREKGVERACFLLRLVIGDVAVPIVDLVWG